MKKHFLALIISVLFFTSCNTFYNEHQKLPNLKWERSQEIAFEVDIPEAKKYTINIHLRHTSQIQYGEIEVKFAIIPLASNDVQAIDKEIIIPIRDSQTGHLLGDAMGDICDTTYKLPFSFEKKGKYKLVLSQQTEDESVASIMEVGISIEK
jgi:gliding motility-associated lipoprotein GldH